MTAPMYFLTVQRDVPSGPLEWLLDRLDKPETWAYLIGRNEFGEGGAYYSSRVAAATGFLSEEAASMAGARMLKMYESGAVFGLVPSEDSRDQIALWLQIQANRRDPMCTGAY